MTSKASEQEVCQSVLGFVADGTYPASEQVIAAEFPASALTTELELLAKAREQVKVSGRWFTEHDGGRANPPTLNDRLRLAH